MNAKQILILLGFCSLFLIALLLRPNLPGGDTYYFVNYIWGITNVLPFETPISVWIMDIMPANFILIKLVMFILTFISCLAISLSGEILNKKTGWLAGIILLCTVFFTTIFINFENDIFSFVFIAWAIFFMLKFRERSEDVWLYLSLLCIIPAGLIWNYAVYFLIPFVILSRFNWKVIVFAGIIILFNFSKYLFGYLPSLSYQEQMPFMSLFAIIFFLVCYMKDYRDKDLYPVILFCTLTAILNLKQTYVLIPFLAISFAVAVSKLSKPVVFFTFLSFIVVLIVILLTIITMYPNNSTNELFDVAQSIQKNEHPELQINYFWDFVYYWAFYTQNNNLTYMEYSETPKTDIVITRDWDNTLNELCISRFSNKTGKVYVCPT